VNNSTVLPVASIVLRVLIVLNWAVGVAILALLVATFVAEQWTFTALGVSAFRTTGIRAIAVLGLVAVPLNHAVLRRLLTIVETVRSGDPFVAANALRLQAIAWVLLALQVLSLFIAGFSTSGWLAVLLTFILARVFAAGAAMRDDLEGTV